MAFTALPDKIDWTLPPKGRAKVVKWHESTHIVGGLSALAGNVSLWSVVQSDTYCDRHGR